MPLPSADIAVADVSTTGGDYTAPTGTVTFTANDAAITQAFMLTEDTVLEDLEQLTYTISVSDATTAMTASVSATAKQAKIFIMDRSSEYHHPFIIILKRKRQVILGTRRDREGRRESH